MSGKEPDLGDPFFDHDYDDYEEYEDQIDEPPPPCPECNGRGTTMEGFTCDYCDGLGWLQI